MTPRRGARAAVRRVRGGSSRYASAREGSVVVDASIAFLWFANEPDRSGARRLLDGDSHLLAPDLMAVETTNAWWKKLRRGEMEPADVDQAVTLLLALGIAWTPAAALLRPAARLAVDLGHPVYDGLYLALAAAHAARIATADERLRKAAERIGLQVWGAEPSASPRRS